MSLSQLGFLWRTFANSPLPHLLVPIVHVLTLLSPPFKYRALICTVLTLGLAYPCYAYSYTTQTNARYMLSLFWMYHLASLAKIVLYNPEHDFWRIDSSQLSPAKSTEVKTVNGEPGKKKPQHRKGHHGHGHKHVKPTLIDTAKKEEQHIIEHEAESMPAFSLAKLRWVAALLFSYRGVGWNWRVKGIPPASPCTPLQFALRQVRNLVLCSAFLTVASEYVTSQHFWSEEQTIEALGWRRRTLILGALAVQSYGSCWLNYSMMGIVRAILGKCDANDWPPPFGDITKVTSLRVFWNSFWHQYLRFMLSSWSHAFVNVLHVKRGTWLSSILQTFFAFSLSGFMHALVAWSVEPTPPFFSFYDRFTTMFLFFLFQAEGVVLEDIVVSLFRPVWRKIEARDKKGRRATLMRWIGRIWVFGWLWWTGQFAVESWLKTGQGLLCQPNLHQRWSMVSSRL